MKDIPTIVRAIVPFLLACGAFAQSRQEILDAMRKASGFFVDKVSKEGGYHYYYAEDLSYGRSEHGEGPTQIELQREATPRVGMAFLEAFDATGDRFYLEAARKAARATVKGQLCSGGWDYLVEFDPEKRKAFPYREDGNCADSSRRPPTTLDDNVTQSAVRLLMRVDKALDFRDAKIHDAVLFALESLMKVQYPNGAWPQRFTAPPDPAKFPVRKASYPDSWSRKWPGDTYQLHYTFNDNTIADCIDMMLEAARIYDDPRYLASAEKGGGFILLAQMPDPQPAWAQQYDLDMHPAWARLFEPPSVTGGESQGVMRILMVLYRETGKQKYLDAVGPALAYLEKSVLPLPDPLPEAWRRMKPGTPVLARFYELKTNRPLYITKGTQIQAKGLGSARIDGYQVSYSPESIITHYAVIISGAGLAGIRADYEDLRKSRNRRDGKLHGLSPWQAAPSAQHGGDARQLIQSMDERGAWMSNGIIGKADRIVNVFSARDMVLTINGKPIEIKENDRIELFQGTQPPRTRIIVSEAFADNLETLAGLVRRN